MYVYKCNLEVAIRLNKYNRLKANARICIKAENSLIIILTPYNCKTTTSRVYIKIRVHAQSKQAEKMCAC